jgi:alpha-tubulin suppressor-like RCC1 family protein
MPAPGVEGAIRFSTSGSNACDVLRDGEVDCWGSGPLGDGHPDVSLDLGNRQGFADTARVIQLAGVGQISAGGTESCAVATGAGAYCWGFNDHLQLGVPAEVPYSIAPVAVPDLARATQVSTGKSFSPNEDHVCARLQDGTVVCWGANDAGQLGRGTLASPAGPATVSGITTAVDVAAGGEHSCAVLQAGTVACWGDNRSGQLGNGTTTSSATPVRVSGITTAVQVAAGERHSCALLQDGTVDCWGDDSIGELGNGHAGNGQSSSVPVAAGIFPAHPATEISAGGEDTCAVMQSGAVSCWGSGDHGQLGNGVIFPYDSSPVIAAGITNATDVSTGQTHVCAVRADGGVACWGSDLNAQLGDRTHIDAAHIDVPLPVGVLDIEGATHVSAGTGDSCATLANGTAACWGSGYLGNGAGLTPAPVIGLPAS